MPLLFAALALVACGDDPSDSATPAPFVAQVQVSPSAVLLTSSGASTTLSAVAYDSDGNEISGDVSWTTDDPDISLSPDGTVTAVAAAGSAQLWAEIDGVRSLPVLALIADPVDDAVLIDDSAVTGIAAEDPDEPYGLGVRYTVSVQDQPVPDVGSVVIGTGEQPVLGRVVEASESAWLLELVALSDAFDDYRVQETWDLSEVEPQLVEGLEGYDLLEDEDGWWSVTPNGERSTDKSWECEAAFSAGSIELGKVKADFKTDLSMVFDDSSDGFQAMLFTGLVHGKVEAGVYAQSTVEGTYKCSATVLEIPVPVTGFLGFFAGATVKLGEDFSFSGKAVVTEMSATLSAGASLDFKLGLDCTTGSCDWVAEADPDGSASPNLTWNEADDLRFEATLTTATFAKGAVGVLFWDLDFVKASAGVQEQLNLATNFIQAESESKVGAGTYASSEELKTYLELSVPLLGDPDRFQGLYKVNLPTFVFTYSPITLAYSPRGDPSEEGTGFTVADRVLEVGQPLTATVSLDPNSTEWLAELAHLLPLVPWAEYNVESVVMYALYPDGDTLVELDRVEAEDAQLHFELSWTPTEEDVASPPTVLAFVDPVWPPLVELEIGNDTRIQLGGDGDFTAVSAGGFHTCALTSSGAIECWGQDNYGSVSDAPAGPGYTAVAAGYDHTCAVTSSGAIECGGYDSWGQVSDAPTGTGYTAVGAGWARNCALTSSGAIECWGRDDYGQVSDAPSGTGYTAVGAGVYHTCALTSSGAIECWGYDDYGQVSDAPTGTGYTAVGAGVYHTCALTSSGAIECWGYDGYGRVSDAPTGTGYAAVAAGTFHTCAVTSSGAIECWGRDDYGQVSDAPTGTGYTAVGAGYQHSCAVTSSGAIECWGYDGWGQVSDAP